MISLQFAVYCSSWQMGKKEAMEIQQSEALQRYNTLALQASADAFVTVRNDEELLSALAWGRANQLPIIPLGAGSNIVLAGDVNALILRQEAQGIEILDNASDTVTVRVSAGYNWHSLVRWSVESGYYGLQNLALIPGCAGAAPIQNIGAYGVELQSSLLRVHARQIADDRPITLTNTQCKFGYRDSVFKHELKDKLVITSIDLQLSTRPDVDIAYPALSQFFAAHPTITPTPQAVLQAVVDIRQSKLPDPASTPNAGSFFKNPIIAADAFRLLQQRFPALPGFAQNNDGIKVPAAWMIDHCGWKGFKHNRLGVHDHHALVLVNYGNDSGEQLLALANKIQTSVEQTFGVLLEIEPRVYGACE
jgi:UDP-N-acetylmuramate dehydrogenase